MKKIILGLLSLLCVFAFFSCDSSEEEFKNDLIDSKKLYVACSTDYAPFEFVDLTKTGQDRFVGSDLALARYIAQELGLTLVIKSMSFESTLTALDSEKVDLAISGYTYKPERAASYMYSDFYYDEGEGASGLVITTANKDKFKTLADFNKEDVVVAVQTGSTQQALVEEQLPDADIKLIDDLQTALDSLVNENYDAVAMAEVPAKTACGQKTGITYSDIEFEMEDSHFYVLTSKDNTKLGAAVNEVIAKVNENNLYATWVTEAEALLDKLGSDADELVDEE